MRKRIPTRPKPKKVTTVQQKKLEEDDKEITKLRQLEIDLKQPLSLIDFKNMATVVTEVEGLAYV